MRWLYYIIFLFSYVSSFAQSTSYKITSFTTANGIPDNSISSIIQDSRGFIWIGTREGLSRYDGTNFKNYFSRNNDSTSLPGNTIASLHEHKPGQLLFQCSGKMVTMNTLNQQIILYPPFKNKIIFGISRIADEGYLVYGTDTCFVLNKNLEFIESLVPPLTNNNKAVIASYLDKNNFLVSSQWENFLYNRVTKKYTPVIIPNNLPPEQRFFVYQYYDPLNQWLYFSNYWSGIFRCSLKGEILQHLSYDKKGLTNLNISFVKPKTKTALWVGTMGGGIYILDTNTDRLQKIDADSTLSNAVVISHFNDRQNNEWIGTNAGLIKLNDVSNLLHTWMKDFSTAGKGYTLLSVTKGVDQQIYLSVFGSNAAYRINPGDKSVSQLNAQSLPYIWSMNRFGNEIIFTGNSTGITKFDPLEKKYLQTNFLKKYFPASEVVILAFKDSRGNEWYSGNNGGGFVRVEPNDSVHHYTKNGPHGNFTVSYYSYYAEDQNGDLWFGVNKTDRLLHWERKSDRFTEFIPGKMKGITGDIFVGISDLTMDSKNNLWIAFDGSGIVKYDINKKEAVHYTLENGLPTNYVYGLQFDGNNRLWMGTPKGLSCLLVDENRFISFTKEDGLAEDNFNERCIYYDSTANRMWLGSTSALMSFTPDSLLHLTQNKLPVYLDRILVNGKPYYFTGDSIVRFQPSQTNFLIHFIGLDLHNGKNLEYSYKLSDADEDWIYNGNNTSASYANLNPGSYSFMVRARHKGDKEWNHLKQPFNFVIRTPWYKTWWFRILMIAFLAALIWYLIRSYYQVKMEKQKQLIEKELAIEQERTRFARELHDGLGSMLSGIKHSFSAMEKQFTLDEGQRLIFHTNIDKLNDSINELRNITHSLGTDNLLKFGLENSLHDYCQNISQSTGLEITFNALGTKNMPLTKEQNFHSFRIVQELIQNILRHSGASQALVQISCSDGHFQIAVEDDGQGFDMEKAKQQKGIGLKNIESRVRILKGKMDYRTAPGKGTSVLIEMSCS